MRAFLIIPVLALLPLAGCYEQKGSETEKKTTSVTEPKVTDQATVPGTAATATTSNTGETATNSSAMAARTSSFDAYKGRTFTTGPLSLQLNADNTFRMDETDGSRKVEGRYTHQDSLLILSDPKGDVGQAQFPMRCRFQESGTNAFQLGETAGSCTRFKDMTFKPITG